MQYTERVRDIERERERERERESQREEKRKYDNDCYQILNLFDREKKKTNILKEQEPTSLK